MTPANPSTELASALTGRHGESVALTDVSVVGVLRDLLAEVTVTQTYRNAETIAIEAVYTFPLPADAVLLDLDVEIGSRKLKGQVVERIAAERGYEDAVSSGDAAVMLEAMESGLYTMNVGNLLPGESAKIAFRYALLHQWSGDRLRIHLPTTIAPRYGAMPLRAHQQPVMSLTVENRFSLRLEMQGALREAHFASPSHALTLARSAETTVISLSQARAVMDRDFVLTVTAARAAPSFALCGHDGEGMAAVASFQPFFGGSHPPRSLDLAIVVDCSGSMAGISIQQAKQALEGIFDSLQSRDRLSLTAFGSSAQSLWHRPLTCTADNLGRARRFAAALDANMGGTEIGAALREAYGLLGSGVAGDVLLITDGQVGDWRPVIEEAKRSGHRLFTVGVGAAVSEGFVRELATTTGGECELVAPCEGMADRIVRQFERMRAPRARRVAVHWPAGAVDTTPSQMGALFEGDTVIATARFHRVPTERTAVLEIETERGEITRHELSLAPMPATDALDKPSTVARVAAAMRMKTQDLGAGRETALRYSLVSAWTNWLVIAERADGDKSADLPALRQVPHTLAAGWGGTAAMSQDSPMLMDAFDAQFDAIPSMLRARREIEPRESQQIDRVAFHDTAAAFDWTGAHRRLLELIDADASWLDAPRAVRLLAQSGFATVFRELLSLAHRSGIGRETIAVILLDHLLAGPLGASLSASARARYSALGAHAQGARASILDANVEQRLTAALQAIDRQLGARAPAL